MLVFKNARVLSKSGKDVFESRDLYVADGVIVPKEEGKVYEEFDCRNLVLLPSFVDIGLSTKDSVLSPGSLEDLSNSALTGGVSSLVLSHELSSRYGPSFVCSAVCSNPRLINMVPIIEAVCEPISEKLRLNDISIELSSVRDYFRCSGREAIPSTMYVDSSVKSDVLYGSMLYSKMAGVPITIHAFDADMEAGVAYSSLISSELGLPSFGPLGQLKEVSKVCCMATFLGVRVLLSRVNVPECLDVAVSSKGVSTQIPLPHLIFDDSHIRDYDTAYKVFPPLLPKESNLLLRSRLRSAVSNDASVMLTSLHNPSSPPLKNTVFESASYGFDSLSLYFSTAYNLVRDGIFSLNEIVTLCSLNPSRFLGLNKGSLDIGFDADFILVDLDHSFNVEDAGSPYRGMNLFGKVQHMVVSGCVVDF